MGSLGKPRCEARQQRHPRDFTTILVAALLVLALPATAFGGEESPDEKTRLARKALCAGLPDAEAQRCQTVCQDRPPRWGCLLLLRFGTPGVDAFLAAKKAGTDIQEEALRAGMGPQDARWLSLYLRWVGALPEQPVASTALNEQQEERLSRASQWSEKALDLEDQGHSKEAVDLLEDVLAVREEILGQAHPETIRSLQSLAFNLRKNDQHLEAKAVSERALALAKEHLGPDHPRTGLIMFFHAYLLEEMGNFVAARPFYEESLTIQRNVLGPMHPDTLVTLNNLGYALEHLDDLPAARIIFEEVLATRTRVLGPDHANTRGSLLKLARVARLMGDNDAARPLLDRLVASDEEALHPNHPDLARHLNLLGLVLLDQGDPEAAEPIFRRALTIRARRWDPVPLDIASSLNNLGSCLQSLGRLPEARASLQRALAIKEERLGLANSNTLITLNNLCSLEEQAGDTLAEFDCRLRTLEARERMHGPGHEEVAQALRSLEATVLGHLEKSPQKDAWDRGGAPDDSIACSLLERLVASKVRILGNTHPDTLDSMESLVMTLTTAGKFDQAKTLIAEVFNTRERLAGLGDPGTRRALEILLTVHGADRDFEGARPYVGRALEIRRPGLLPLAAAPRDEARSIYQKGCERCATDPECWRSVLLSAWFDPDVEAKGIVIGAWRKMAGRVKTPDIGFAHIPLLAIAVEAQATGAYDEGLARLKDYMAQIGDPETIPPEALAMAMGLAQKAGNMEAARVFSALFCDRTGGGSSCRLPSVGLSGLSNRALTSRSLRSSLDSIGVQQDVGIGRLPKSLEGVMDDVGVSISEQEAERYRTLQGEFRWLLHEAKRKVHWAPGEALDLVNRAASEMRQDAPVEHRVDLRRIEGMVLLALNRKPDALAAFGRALALANTLREPRLRDDQRLSVATSQMEAGLCTESLALRRDLRRNYLGYRLGVDWLTFQFDDAFCELNQSANTASDESFQEATAAFEELAPFWNDLGLELFSIMGASLLSGACITGGRHAEAVSWIRRAIASSESALQRLGHSQAADFFAGTGGMTFDWGISLVFTRIASLLSEQGDWSPESVELAKEALSHAERSRAWLLLQELRRKGLEAIRAALPPRVVEEESKAIGDIAAARERLLALSEKEPWKEAAIASARNDLATAESALSRFADRLWKEHPLYASVRFPRPLEFQQIPLRDDELFVEFRAGMHGNLYVWLVERSPETGIARLRNVFVVEMAPGVFKAALDRVRAWQQAPRRSRADAFRPLDDVDGLAKTLCSHVVRNLDPARHRQLLVVPDDAMVGIPLELFDLEPIGGCRGPDGATGRVLSDCVSVEYLPSATVLAVRRSIPVADAAQGELLAVGDPVFSPADPRAAKLPKPVAAPPGGSGPCPELVRLHSTADQARRAQKVLCGPGVGRERCRVLLGADAVEDSWFRAVRTGYRVVHVGTHLDTVPEAGRCPSLAEGGEPALALSVALPSKDDNRVARSEVMALDLASTELAVLSSCSSAGGRDEGSEGVAGLAAAFLRAGARQVVGSLWPVDAEATTRLMDAFYREYSTTRDAARSLAAARKAVRRDSRFDAPFFWAGFVLFGARP